MEVLGKRLKWLRNKNRYTQKEIAKLIGMTPSGLQKIENDERDPKLDVLMKFCDIYNVSSDFLLGRDNTVGVLEDIAINLYMVSSKVNEVKAMISKTEQKVHQVSEEIRHFEKINGSQMSIDTRKNLLDRMVNDLNSYKDRSYSLMKEHSDAVLRYLNELLEIPFVKLSEDQVLKRYLPIGAEIQPDIFNSYSLHLYGENVGFIGHYGDFHTIDEALEFREEFLAKINGTIKQ